MSSSNGIAPLGPAGNGRHAPEGDLNLDPNLVPYGIEAEENEGLRQYLYAANALAELSDPTWLIDGLLPAKGLTVLYGASGSGKTFLGLHLASLVAQEHPVLYVAAEGEYGFKGRVAALEKYHGKEAGDLSFYFNVAPLLDPKEEFAFSTEIIEFVR